jgi:hypothetical protein
MKSTSRESSSTRLPLDAESLAENTPEREERVAAVARAKYPGRFTRWLLRGELKLLQRFLADEERLITVADAALKRPGLLAVSDRRLIFLRDGVTGNEYRDWPYSSISGISSSVHPRYGTIVFRLHDDEVVIRPVSPKERAKEVAVYVQKQLSGGSYRTDPRPS